MDDELNWKTWLTLETPAERCTHSARPRFAPGTPLLCGPTADPVVALSCAPTPPLYGGLLDGMELTYEVAYPDNSRRRVYEYQLSTPCWEDAIPDWLSAS